jgi:hypothetical protein
LVLGESNCYLHSVNGRKGVPGLDAQVVNTRYLDQIAFSYIALGDCEYASLFAIPSAARETIAQISKRSAVGGNVART